MMAEQSTCPSPALLAQFVDGLSDPAQRVELTAHVAGCAECYDIVTGTARFLEQGEPAQATVHAFPARRWWLATAAAITVATAVGLLSDRIWSADPVERLASAARSAPFRASEGRLAGFAYAPIQPTTRAAVHEEIEPSMLRVRGVAGEVLEDEESSTAPRSLYAAGIAHLLVGHERRAVEKLEAATGQDQRNARLWSDLAAARLALARDEHSPELIPEALAAADAALDIDSQLPEGLFNRARALDSLRLSKPAIQAYEKFLEVEPGSLWAEEARQRIRQLKASMQSQSWNEALPRLEKLAAASDAGGVRAIVAAFPQDARTWGETECLGEWAAAVNAGDQGRAAERLHLARLIGDALIKVNGEPILHGAVKAIDDSDDNRRKVLTAAHEEYRTGWLSRRQEPTASLPHLQRSCELFRAAGSPMWMLAGFYATVAQQVQGADESRLAVIRTLRFAVPPSSRVLYGLSWWQEGTLLLRQRRIHEAVDAYRESLAKFESAGERENAATVRTHLAQALEFSGESSDAWEQRIASFDGLSATPDASRLQLALSWLAAELFRKRNFLVATAVSRVASELPPGAASNRRARADAFLWRALALHELHDARAAQSLERAKQEADLISDRVLRRSALSDISFAESHLIAQSDPARSSELLSAVLVEPIHTRRFFAKPEVLLARSRILARMGRSDDALSDLREAAEIITSTDTHDRPQIFPAVASEVFDELLAALVLRGSVVEVFHAADSARTHTFFERLSESSRRLRHRDVDIRQIQAMVPTDALLLQYVSLPGELLIIAVDRENARIHRVPVARADLHATIARWVGTLSATTANPELLAEQAAQMLIAPVSAALETKRTIITSLDPRLGPLPLAALKYRGSYLIEQFDFLIVPSISLWASASPERHCSRPSALVVGNPMLNRRMFPDLLPLVEAQVEASELAEVYPDNVMLSGAQATRRAVLRQLPSHCVLHIASHAVVEGRDPAYSFLLLSEEKQDSGRLYGYEIAKLNLNTVWLVVLAGCKTAAPSPNDSFPSLTAAFVAAGARSSIGTLWNTEDRVAREFSLRLHRSLRADRSVSSVVRDVQLSMLRSSDEGLRTPRAWGAFQLITAGS